MARKIEKVEVTETPEIESQSLQEMLDEAPKTAVNRPPLVLTHSWDDLKPTLEKLGLDDLKAVVDYCNGIIDELQREEVEALEAQMREIQEKLSSLKRPSPVASPSNSRNVKPLRNPDNPSEVYTTGMTPLWVKNLVARTGKAIYQLREESD